MKKETKRLRNVSSQRLSYNLKAEIVRVATRGLHEIPPCAQKKTLLGQEVEIDENLEWRVKWGFVFLLS